MNRPRSRALVSVSVALPLLVGGVGVAGSASAATTNPYSSSFSSWNSVPTVKLGSAGNLVGLWQNILYGDGTLNKCTSVVPSAAIDGHFGGNTEEATKTWQKYHGLSADGSVGPLTWKKAWSYVVWDDVPPFEGASFGTYDYVGENTIIMTARDASSNYGTPKVWRFDSISNPSNGFAPVFKTPDITFYEC